MKYIHISIEYL